MKSEILDNITKGEIVRVKNSDYLVQFVSRRTPHGKFFGTLKYLKEGHVMAEKIGGSNSTKKKLSWIQFEGAWYFVNKFGAYGKVTQVA